MFEVHLRVVVDTTTKQSAEQYRDDLMAQLPSWAEVVACEGTVKGATVIPVTTQKDVDRGFADLYRMAKQLNRHASVMEDALVEKRLRLTREFSRSLNRFVDDLDQRHA